MNQPNLICLLPPLKKSTSAILLLGSLLVGLIPAANAQFSIDFVELNGNTTATYSGSWVNWNPSNTTGNSLEITNGSFNSIAGAYGANSHIGVGGMPWTTATATSRTGDNFGFNSGENFAPDSYTAGLSIAGTLVFDAHSLTNLGFSAGEIASGGSFDIDSTTLTWSASVSAVPEPSSYALLAALVTFGFVGLRRRRPPVSHFV